MIITSMRICPASKSSQSSSSKYHTFPTIHQTNQNKKKISFYMIAKYAAGIIPLPPAVQHIKSFAKELTATEAIYDHSRTSSQRRVFPQSPSQTLVITARTIIKAVLNQLSIQFKRPLSFSICTEPRLLRGVRSAIY